MTPDHETPIRAAGRILRRATVGALLAVCSPAALADVAALERRVDELTRELAAARAELAAARDAGATADTIADADVPTAAGDEGAAGEGAEIRVGPVTIGGASRVNYVYGSYDGGGSGPSRGGNGGDVELDTIRVNAALEADRLTGRLEYRWYNGYNFVHTGWLGYEFDDVHELRAGVVRVPFGPGPYGVSQSWFFDQHYYVGLSDDPDLGVRYVGRFGSLALDLAWFARSEGNWNGASIDSARYGYDVVKWRSGLDDQGNVVQAANNGYEERNQFNLRAIYGLEQGAFASDLGVSLQYGGLDGKRADDGHHWAASAHAVNRYGNLTVAGQLTRYSIDGDSGSALGTDALVPMGAYDFAWPAATEAWLPAVSVSYRVDTPGLGWLDYVLPYAEYSNIMKREGDFNDSSLVTTGAAWANGGWYIYTEVALSDGNYFVGDRNDDYSNLFDGVGDFGANGNDQWQYRVNFNFGYYF